MSFNFSKRIEFALRGRNPSIDFLRGLSILVVVMLHFGMYYVSKTPSIPRMISFTYWGVVSRNGYLGVSAFFVISGFLITSRAIARYGAFNKISFWDFYTFRFARIVPPLLLLVVAAVALHFADEPGFVFGDFSQLTPWEIFVGAASLRLNLYWGTAVSATAIGVLWSLSIEEAFYVFFPVVGKILRKTYLMAAAFIGLFIYGVVYRSQMEYPGVFFDYFSCLDLLALGGLIAMFKARFPHCAAKLENKWLNGLALLAAVAFYLSHHDREWAVWGSTIFGPLIGFFILSADSRLHSTAYSGRFSKILRVMGVYCYEIYLFHIAIIFLMTHYLFPLLNEMEFTQGAIDFFFIIFWIGTMLFSIFVSEFYSEPARKAVKRWSAKIQAKISAQKVPFGEAAE